MSSRVMEFLTSVPIITRCLLAINVSIHVLVFLTSWPIDSFTMSPWFVLYRGEYYRVMSSVFLHAGILHLFMNMSTLIAIGPSLEHHFGSLKMLLITLWTILLGGIFFVFIVWVYSFYDPGGFGTNAIGYSGVLFSYAVIEAFHSAETSRSIFGIISVPIKLYPFVLLLVLQVVLPNISLWGHLSGLLVGLLLLSRLGQQLLMPSNDGLLFVEQTWRCCCRAGCGYVEVSNMELVHPYLDTTGSSLAVCKAVASTVVLVLQFVRNVVVTVLYAVGIRTEPIERCCSSIGTRFYALCVTIVMLPKTMLSSIYCCSASPVVVEDPTLRVSLLDRPCCLYHRCINPMGYSEVIQAESIQAESIHV